MCIITKWLRILCYKVLCYSAKRCLQTSSVSASMCDQHSETSRYCMICNTRFTLQKIGVRLRQKKQENRRLQIVLTTHGHIPISFSVFTFLPSPILWTIPHYLEVMEGCIGRFGDELDQIEEMLNERKRHTLLTYMTFAESFSRPTVYSTPKNITLLILYF